MSRVRFPQAHLLRFVKSPDGLLVEDISGKLPGHGLYVLPTVGNINRLMKRSGIVGETEAVVGRCGLSLSRRFLDGLGLARRAGVVRRGVREVDALLQAGHRPFLVLAADTAVHTRQKLSGVLRRCALEKMVELEMVELLDRESLGVACGWSAAAVLAVDDPGLGHRLRVDAFRWRAFHQSPEVGG